MSTHIFYCGGRDKNGSYTNAQQIRKYANAGDTNAANHGSAQLTQSHSQGSSGTSDTHGFVTAGFDTGNTDIKQISTFPYASETNSTDHGDLLFTTRQNRGGASSSSHGYNAGGATSSAPFGRNVIEKYSTTSAANSTDVGDLANALTHNSLGYK